MQLRARRDFNHDAAGRHAIEMRATTVATGIADLSGSNAGRRQLSSLRVDCGKIVDIEADVKCFRINLRVVLLQLHQGENELLVIAQDHQGSRASLKQLLESEVPLEKRGKTRHVRGREIEMFDLHGFHPSCLEKRTAATASSSMSGAENSIFARPTGSVTTSSLRPAVGPSRW